MKVAIISSSDLVGGAAKAAYRLHTGLKNIGVNAQMLVRTKASDDSAVSGLTNNFTKAYGVLQPTLDRLPLRLYRQCDHRKLCLEWMPDGLNKRVQKSAPDVVNIHGVSGGFLKIETVPKFQKPIVFTLHDLWAFTGGCHYNEGCDRYTQTCGNCPEIKSHQDWDLSRWVWQRKAKAWKNLNLTVVSPSHWLADCAKKSSLFQNLRIEVIPNGLDAEIYRPVERSVARNLLNLPQDRQLILFGAMSATSDQRKGFHLLQPALQRLSQSPNASQIELVIFGASQPNSPIDFGFKTHYVGQLNDDLSLALIYSASDVFVAPSLQDNLPNTLLESLACGTPCVGFKVGGIPDLIEHQQTGYLAQPYEVQDLTNGIAWVLENPERHQNLCQRSRQKIEQGFTLEHQAHRYLSIFKEISS